MQDTKCVIKQLTISSVEGEFENLFPLTSLLVNSMHGSCSNETHPVSQECAFVPARLYKQEVG